MNFIKVMEKYNADERPTFINLDNVNYIQRKAGKDTYVSFKDKTYIFVQESVDDIASLLDCKIVSDVRTRDGL